ncbi:hypothetical protein BaRGS_00018599 [Batillaria attramentaria]|uniref:Uncharacterized protein n=1 Tax=Batillaria attramentaria TaxID=370345 RepID=A0ABD0KTL2_9CAEN
MGTGQAQDDFILRNQAGTGECVWCQAAFVKCQRAARGNTLPVGTDSPTHRRYVDPSSYVRRDGSKEGLGATLLSRLIALLSSASRVRDRPVPRPQAKVRVTCGARAGEPVRPRLASRRALTRNASKQIVCPIGKLEICLVTRGRRREGSTSTDVQKRLTTTACKVTEFTEKSICFMLSKISSSLLDRSKFPADPLSRLSTDYSRFSTCGTG